jgi:mersacidin/lichenicidin family type 2 lantibiotic
MGNDVRAWKDPFYREKLIAAGEPVFHPAGLVELSDEDLKKASGMVVGPVETTAPECTFYTFQNRRSCCPR